MNFQIDTFIVLGTLVLMIFGLLIIGFVVYYQRRQFKYEINQNIEKQQIALDFQKKLLENSLEVQEFERQRLAKDLHDEVGAILSTLKMSNNQILKKVSDLDTLQELAQNNKELIDESISIVRSISKDLVPQTLENFGLYSAIEEFFNKIGKHSNKSFKFKFEGFSESIRFKNIIELNVFRIVQELSNNALKHAQAEKIDLFFSFINEELYFCFSDNGVGFDFQTQLDNAAGGLGLRNIESRLSVIGGEMETNSKLGSGAKFEIWIKDVTGYEKN
jgi:signal transduction histidine kinase